MQPKHYIRVGISSCLIGQPVRYNGRHKKNTYITQSLAHYFDFVPICPESAIGMGVPRPPIQLVDREGNIRAVSIQNQDQDFTNLLSAYGHEMSKSLSGISGYILKKDSPSCGMERVRVFEKNSISHKRGRGIYAASLIQGQPLLPVEEEGRLQDPVLRENFIERIFIYYRWQQLVSNGLTASGLIDFHSRHKFNLLAHDQTIYRRLGRLVSEAGSENIDTIAHSYIDMVMLALRKPATKKNHGNVLMHIMGFLKDQLASDDKQELLRVLDAYRQGQVPLVVPITLFRHHLRHHPHPYITQQYYIDPYPEEMMLRNSL
ncbi:YbgA family protein [Pseudomonadota bacterium]